MADFRLDNRNWAFLNGPWSGGPDGQFIPADDGRVEYIAVVDDAAYGDFTARYRFKYRNFGGGARLLFRVQDARRFYALDVPANGQQFRSRHFWAGLVIGDGTPLQRYLQFGLVPGLCARVDHWYDARVEARGSHLRAWINDILVADVEDTTYQVGRLGLSAISSPYYEAPHFSSLQIDGESAAVTPWPGLHAPKQHWITPCRETDPSSFQSYASMLQSGTGEVVLYLTTGNPAHGDVRRTFDIRSVDAGRTWGEPEQATFRGLGAPLVRKDGTWMCIFADDSSPEKPLYSFESPNEGGTWSRRRIPLNFEGEWPEGWKAAGPASPIRMHDGAWVLPVTSSLADNTMTPSLVTFQTCFVLRSEDDGHTWSAPVLCDSSHNHPDKPLKPEIGGGLMHAARFYELGMDEVDDDVLIGIGRPERDPYMWQIQSNDGGRTWEPAALGHFPGYCPSLTSTRSGDVIATTRHPYFSAHLSRDRGRTWQPPVILDYAQWANQQALEVEPDVVLVTYMGHIMDPGQADSRIARLRAKDGLLTLDH